MTADERIPHLHHLKVAVSFLLTFRSFPLHDARAVGDTFWGRGERTDTHTHLSVLISATRQIVLRTL